MATLRTGEIVLFTGQKLVWAVEKVGYSFRNAAFADTLWHPHCERGSYRNVYSLLTSRRRPFPTRRSGTCQAVTPATT